MRGNRDVELGVRGVQFDGGRIESNDRRALLLIEPTIEDFHFASLNDRIEQFAAAVALRTADLEYVGKISPKDEFKGDIHWVQRVVPYPQSVVKNALPDKCAAKHVDHVARQDHLAIVRKIRIGQIDVERGVIFLDGRTQEQRPATGGAEFETAQE